MADPQSYFGIAPPQPNTAFFNANSGRRNVGGLKALLGEQQRFQEYDVNRGQNAQQLREQEFYRLADEQAQIVMPMIQQLDYRDPDYNVKRQEIERQAPLAGLSKSVRDLFNEKDARYYNETQRADYQKRGELTPADLAGSGVEQSVIDTLMMNGKLDQVAANRAIFQQKNAPKPERELTPLELAERGLNPAEVKKHTKDGKVDQEWLADQVYQSKIPQPEIDKDLTYEEMLKSGIPPRLAQQAYDAEAGVWVPSKAAEIVGQWKRKQLQSKGGGSSKDDKTQAYEQRAEAAEKAFKLLEGLPDDDEDRKKALKKAASAYDEWQQHLDDKLNPSKSPRAPKAPKAPSTEEVKMAKDRIATMGESDRAKLLETMTSGGATAEEIALATQLVKEAPLPKDSIAAIADKLPPTLEEFNRLKQTSEASKEREGVLKQSQKDWVAAENSLKTPLLKLLPKADTPEKQIEELVLLRAIWNNEPIPTGDSNVETGADITMPAGIHFLQKMGKVPNDVMFSDPDKARWGTQKVNHTEVIRALARKLFWEKTGKDLASQPPTGAPPSVEFGIESVEEIK